MNFLKNILIGAVLIGTAILSGCGDDSTESVILGTWLGTAIIKSGCDDFTDNGVDVNCEHNIENCSSCVKLRLRRQSLYSLTTNFDANKDNESGTYEAKDGIVRLSPNSGNAYDLPISEVSKTTMKIKLNRDGGCTATITLTNTECN